MANKVGQLINLDEGQGQIISGKIIDSIDEPATRLLINFISEVRLPFQLTNDIYFTYKGNDWVAINYKETSTPNGVWSYDMDCYPRGILSVIDKPCETTLELARSMGLDLFESSDNLPIKCPMVNVVGAWYIQTLKKIYFDEAFRKGNMGLAYFLYFNRGKFLSTRFENLFNQGRNELPKNALIDGHNTVSYIDERAYTYFTTANGCEYYRLRDYIRKILGRKIEIKSPMFSEFLKLYTIKFVDNDRFDQRNPFLCVRVEADIMDANQFLCTFSELLIDKKTDDNYEVI